MKHRLFVAVDLPVEVKSQVEAVQRRLDQLPLPVSWEPVHKVHLTLVFLGALASDNVARTRQVVESVANSAASGLLQPVSVEALYRRHEPAVIYLLLADTGGRIGELQHGLATELDKITPQPRRKWLPHATIGRIKKSDPTSVKQSLDKLAEVDIAPLPQFPVNEIHLYESFLSKAGSSYSRLASFNLGKRE